MQVANKLNNADFSPGWAEVKTTNSTCVQVENKSVQVGQVFPNKSTCDQVGHKLKIILPRLDRISEHKQLPDNLSESKKIVPKLDTISQCKIIQPKLGWISDFWSA